MCVGREDVVGNEVMLLTEHIVVDIVCRGHFKTASTETDLYVTVFDDRNLATYNRYTHMFAAQPLVFLLFRVDADCYVAEDSFRTGCGNDGVFAGLFHDFVFEVVELRVLVVVDHLLVAQCCLALRIPVHHAESAVDEAFVVQVAEDADHGFGARLVHREGCTIPVTRATEFA